MTNNHILINVGRSADNEVARKIKQSCPIQPMTILGGGMTLNEKNVQPDLLTVVFYCVL